MSCTCVEKLSRVATVVFRSPTGTCILLVDKGPCPAQVACNICYKTCDVGPNITGTAQGDEFPTTELVQLDGAFYKIGTHGDTETGGGHGSAIIGFDASLSNGIYGGSSTVQPLAVMLLPAIKT